MRSSFIFGIFLFPLSLFAQIFGVVNDYSPVLSVNAVSNLVVVSNPAAFTAGDLVLLIQIQGASIDESNNPSFGNILAINDAGAYELNRVCEVNGSDISFENTMINSYNPSGAMAPGLQLIRVPEYNNVSITATLTAAPWDGSSGGILAISAFGTIDMQADIDVSGQGFRGGENEIGANNCTFLTSRNDYFYNQASGFGGKKGEGIAAFTAGREYGRGAQANGGGGGNDHNAGGGGGANANNGGLGGTYTNAPAFGCKGNFPGQSGIGQLSQGYSLANNQVFMGGGGGAGHDNNGDGVDGGNGGGIVLLFCNMIEGNGHAIRANGETPANAGGDAGSGGGAGGTLLLSTNSFGTTMLDLEVDGGNGGGAGYIGARCLGPGGGGSGGVIWTSTNPPGANVTTSLIGGSAGINNPALTCGVSGAQAGSNGNLITNPVYSLPISSSTFPGCILPVEILSFSALPTSKGTHLSWQLLPQEDIQSLRLRRKRPHHIQGEDIWISKDIQTTEFLDTEVVNGNWTYQLVVELVSGGLVLSDWVEVAVSLPETLRVSTDPHGNLYLRLSSEAEIRSLKLISLNGQMFHPNWQRVSGNQFMLTADHLSPGIYVIELSLQNTILRAKVLIP
ncbi:MAG: hypothetical protein AAF206_07985 [Bacteroidota bacterium]